MNFRVQKRRGIGNVITTLIILIASVVLGAGVIFFGGSMFQTNTQAESIKVSNVHTWVPVTSNGTLSVTAFAVQNTGSKAITINSVSLRGLPLANANWYSCAPANCGTSTNVNTDLPASYSPQNGVTLADGTNYPFTAGAISLNQGQATIVYLKGAGNIQQIDAGNTYSLQVAAGQSQAVLQVQVISK